MRPSENDINACPAEFNATLAAEDFDYWYDRIDACLGYGTNRDLVAIYAQRKFYPELVKALSVFEAEADAYEAPEHGDWESDYDTY